MINLYEIVMHFTLISSILILLFVLIGAFFCKFGEKHYKIYKRYLPFLVYPRKERNYTIAYKLTIILGLVLTIVIYILFLLSDRS